MLAHSVNVENRFQSLMLLDKDHSHNVIYNPNIEPNNVQAVLPVSNPTAGTSSLTSSFEHVENFRPPHPSSPKHSMHKLKFFPLNFHYVSLKQSHLVASSSSFKKKSIIKTHGVVKSIACN